MNPLVVAQMIYEILSPFTALIASFFVGFSLLAATAVLVVKTVSYK
jgi:hypothetical protein